MVSTSADGVMDAIPVRSRYRIVDLDLWSCTDLSKPSPCSNKRLRSSTDKSAFPIDSPSSCFESRRSSGT